MARTVVVNRATLMARLRRLFAAQDLDFRLSRSKHERLAFGEWYVRDPQAPAPRLRMSVRTGDGRRVIVELGTPLVDVARALGELRPWERAGTWAD